MNWKILTSIIVLAAAVVAVACLYNPADSTPPRADDTGATSEGTGRVVNASNQFALDLYSEIKDEGGNVFFSPYSISTALAMTYEGARGKTAEEIEAVFHFPKDDGTRRSSYAALHNQLNNKSAKYRLHTANAIWVQKDFQILKEFTDPVQRYYAGNATNLDFAGATEEARKTINSWVEGKTNSKIKDLFPQGSLNSLTRVVLTNAIYFKGNWVKQFDKKETRPEDFRISPDNTVQAPMMRRTDEEAKFNYTETAELQIVEMLYEGKELSMLILLPKNDDIKSLESSLTPGKINEWKNNLKEQRVDIYIPKFTFDSKYFLNENLKKMGMPSAFTPDSADFSGIDGKKDLFIQIVVHQAFVEVNEEGTEAAAGTGVGIGLTSMPSATVFRADHPFIFIIQEKNSGNILFMGKVVNPG